MLPLLLRGGRLIVAVEDPSRPEVLDDMEFAAQTKIVPVLARASLLAAAIAKAYERIGAATGGGAGGALGNYMGNKSDDDDRRYRGRDDRRYYRDGHPGRGHAYGHRKNKHHYRD